MADSVCELVGSLFGFDMIPDEATEVAELADLYSGLEGQRASRNDLADMLGFDEGVCDKDASGGCLFGLIDSDEDVGAYGFEGVGINGSDVWHDLRLIRVRKESSCALFSVQIYENPLEVQRGKRLQFEEVLFRKKNVYARCP